MHGQQNSSKQTIKQENSKTTLCWSTCYMPHFIRDSIQMRHDMTQTSRWPIVVSGHWLVADLRWLIWLMRGDDLYPSNVMNALESIVVNGMGHDMTGESNSEPIWRFFRSCIFLGCYTLLRPARRGDPILRLDRHHPAFVLTWDVQYLR
jgi:hypothetical protein